MSGLNLKAECCMPFCNRFAPLNTEAIFFYIFPARLSCKQAGVMTSIFVIGSYKGLILF